MYISLFDTHAHYDHPMFENRGPDLVKKMFDRGVVDGVVIPAITYESNYNRKMFPENIFPYVYFAAGIHPKCATNEAWWDDEKCQEFNMLVSDPRTVAIKTGLDFCKKKLTEAQKSHQIKFLEYMISVANNNRLPLVLHIREAKMEIIDVLRGNKLKVEAVAHCYTYDSETADLLMEVGITRFGIGGMLTRENMGHLRKFVKMIPMQSILLETDAPFVKPLNYEGNINASDSLIENARLISELKNISLDIIIKELQRNAYDFYGIKG